MSEPSRHFRLLSGPRLSGIALGNVPNAQTRRFIALVPGIDAPLVHLDLPDGVSGPARLRIARRQLIDRLGQGMAELELHPLVLDNRPWTRAVLVAPEVAASWRSDPMIRDRRCRGVAPDYFALPAAEDAVVVAADAGLVRVRIGSEDGFSAPATSAAFLLSAALPDKSPKSALLIGEVPAEVKAVLLDANVPINVEPANMPSPRRATAGLDSIDLRRDPGQAADHIARALLAWSIPALLALAAAGVASFDRMRDIRALNAETEFVRAATVELLRQRLIPSAPILDIRTQVGQRLEDLNAADPVPNGLAVLQNAADVIAAADVEPRSITMSQTDLRLALRATDFGELASLIDALEAVGLRAVTDQARTTGEGQIEADISIALEVADR